MMMKKNLFILTAAAVMLTGCGADKNSAPDGGAYTFTDDLGRTVTVDSPQRTAALLGSFADVWQLSGGNIVAAPNDAWIDFDFDLPEDVVNLGQMNELSMELLFSADPDFIIASSNTRVDLDWLDTLESTGIPVAYFDVSDFDDYLRMLKICTDITGREDLYETNGLEVQKQIDEVISRSESRKNDPPTVLSLRASAASIRAKNSKGNVLGEMLKNLGCVNIADNNDSLLENLSMEYIIECDPDYIFFVQMGDDSEGMKKNVEQFIADNPPWQELSAVKAERVYFMDKKLYSLKPNSRWGEAYEKLEGILNENG